MFEKLLIANRGEIARRINFAAREMGIKTVAIYSDPDAEALHVIEADEAYGLDGIESAETYLDISKVIAIAKKSGAQAIHPGYGFLSENANFANACEQEGIQFIGPSSKVITLLGSKIASKELAKKINISMVPGYSGEIPHGKKLQELAEKIGYPLLIKAAAGGGGKGMRVVHGPEELEEMIAGAEREAFAFFKDKTLFIERYFVKSKHIEVQILGDHHGNLIHLFERECSVQRRHQKMIEESPSPSLSAELRQRICEAAIKIAQAAGYCSAGTVEFLVDEQSHFYFLEVNTRLQVEHPVTEMVTGIDLVKAQIRIAAGETLNITQSQISQRGHAIECRLYAEDPENHFLPSEGKIGILKEPARPGIRIDSALEQGKPVLPYYDPMLAKLIVWGSDRQEAIQKMRMLLEDFSLLGIRHNLDFLKFVHESQEFIDGHYHTHSVAEWMPSFLSSRQKDKSLSHAIALLASQQPVTQPTMAGSFHEKSNPILRLAGFRNV